MKASTTQHKMFFDDLFYIFNITQEADEFPDAIPM
jgi:hypothetical protein